MYFISSFTWTITLWIQLFFFCFYFFILLSNSWKFIEVGTSIMKAFNGKASWNDTYTYLFLSFNGIFCVDRLQYYIVKYTQYSYRVYQIFTRCSLVLYTQKIFSFWFSSNLNNSFTTTSVYIFQVFSLVWFVPFFISHEFSHFDYYCVSDIKLLSLVCCVWRTF